MNSVFVYTREAHPGDAWPAHSTREAKLEAARKFAADYAVKRPVLVDSLDGAAHLAYGALPNMSFIIGRGGRVVYKADWTDDRTIRHALEQIGRDRAERRGGGRLTPYYVELLPHRPNSTEDFLQGLLDVPGPRAAREFLDAIAARSGESAVRQMREFVGRQSGAGRASAG